MADVFISYSKTRAAEAAELAAELSDVGFSVWWDTSLLPTGSFGATIDRELDAAKAVVVIWSPESVRSKWVRAEAEHGDRQNKLVNTHTADIGDPGSQIPKPFNQTHSVVIDNIRAIVAALGALDVPRSGGRGTPTPVVAPADSVADADDRLFAEVEKANTADAYAYYLGELPQGRHAPVAKFRRADKRGAQAGEEHANSQRWRLQMISLGFAGWVVSMGVVLAVNWGRLPWQRTEPPAGTAPAGTPPAPTRPQFADVSVPVPLSLDRERALKPKDTFKECADCPAMVVVPAGNFAMGSSTNEAGRDTSEDPLHIVSFARPFAVGRFAVTFDEWAACVKDGGCNRYQPADEGWGRGRRPVINVSWNDAKAYVAWLSQKTGKAYRLPSEAEREYVARAWTVTPFWWGTSISTGQANYEGTSTYGGGPKGEFRRQTLPVDSFEPNPWGLFQVHGNVWEWVEDCWNDSYGGAPVDGSAWVSGDCTRRVVRGGSWIDVPGLLRAANRYGESTVVRNYILGFRVGRTLAP